MGRQETAGIHFKTTRHFPFMINLIKLTVTTSQNAGDCTILLHFFLNACPRTPLGTRAIASHASLPLFLQKGLAGMPFRSDKKFVWGGGIESRCHERPAVSHRRRHGSRTDLEHGARAQRAELTNHERRQSTAGFA